MGVIVLYSMTGYGKGSVQSDGRELTIELKSVNHRFLDVSCKFPRHLTFLEDVVRGELSSSLARGHIDVFIYYQNTRDDAFSVSVNLPLLHAYKEAYSSIISTLNLSETPRLSNYIAIPKLIEVEEKDNDQDSLKLLTKNALSIAIAQLVRMREKEGNQLQQDLYLQLDVVKENVQAIDLLAQRVPVLYRQRLEERLSQLSLSPIDPQRLAQEVALFADKSAIDEELSRLHSHIDQVAQSLAKNSEIGRKLDFLLQEMNREINTVGAKASDIDITNHVVTIKSALEKMREQVQNVE